jgi:hypothetical protein
MIWEKARHDPCITEKIAINGLDRPPRKPMLRIRRAIAVKFGVALGAVDRSTKVKHHVRVGMHLSERHTMFVAPRKKL